MPMSRNSDCFFCFIISFFSFLYSFSAAVSFAFFWSSFSSAESFFLLVRLSVLRSTLFPLFSFLLCGAVPLLIFSSSQNSFVFLKASCALENFLGKFGRFERAGSSSSSLAKDRRFFCLRPACGAPVPSFCLVTKTDEGFPGSSAERSSPARFAMSGKGFSRMDILSIVGGCSGLSCSPSSLEVALETCLRDVQQREDGRVRDLPEDGVLSVQPRTA
ncbi:hypothetical protein MHBO_001504 [Bonamia ostreae]|uniref:Transmembrane protein n=1 Tax=Bonamia ostreae TaxID=126728 RepID=A0ABV2AJT5_9EUKA